MGGPDLFAPAPSAAPALPPAEIAARPAVDVARLMRGMLTLPRLSPLRNEAGQDCCLPCGAVVDTAKPFVAVGGVEERITESGVRERRRAPVLMHVGCHRDWWAAHCARALEAGAA